MLTRDAICFSVANLINFIAVYCLEFWKTATKHVLDDYIEEIIASSFTSSQEPKNSVWDRSQVLVLRRGTYQLISVQIKNTRSTVQTAAWNFLL